jgi:hypothetical protein
MVRFHALQPAFQRKLDLIPKQQRRASAGAARRRRPLSNNLPIGAKQCHLNSQILLMLPKE